jgi:hypothetical protein
MGGNVADVEAGAPGWRDLELGAPEIARLGAARLNAAQLAMLGTLRRDGSPRISPVEPNIADGQLLMGAMTWSAKAHDLRRDPRCVLHSVVTGPDSGETELKLYGSVIEASPRLRDAAAGAWWLTCEPDRAIVFCLAIARAVLVDWDMERGEATIYRWSSRHGYSEARRPYP